MVTVRRLAELLAQMVARPDLVPEFLEPRPGDVMTLHADVRRAHELLKFHAKIDIETGLARYLEWFRTHHNNFADLLEENPRNWRLLE
jgi:nucleoside-diphosphate-sugar epimerase